MSDLRTAAQQALEALESGDTVFYPQTKVAIAALKAALAEPGDFDHGIGADRFKVMRGAYWWHVLIGDGTRKYGKFHTQAGAEEMAALLLREFKNGAFVQHRAALAEPVQEPYCYVYEYDGVFGLHREFYPKPYNGMKPSRTVPVYTAPPQRKPLSEEEITQVLGNVRERLTGGVFLAFARAIERAHGITGDKHGS